jgi:hypothetical protein
MKKIIASLAVVFVIVIGSTLVSAWRQDTPKPETQKPEPQAATGVKGKLPPADATPQWDRGPFRMSAQSIARADLLACRNKQAALTQGRDADVESFAKAINGVWLNENRRTVHGMPVMTDAAFYIQMKGTSGVGILIDRSNLGGQALAAPFRSKSSSFAKLRPARPLSMKQVNCTVEFVDEYVKVTDQAPAEALARSTGVKATPGMTLVEVWKGMVANGYFNEIDMPLSNDPAGAKRRLKAELGDGARVAVTVDGTGATEPEIERGLVPAAEYELPMLVGGIFRITLTPVPAGGARKFRTVRMRWDAEYRGAGIGTKPGEAVFGIEQGDFVMEGNAFVSARSMFGSGNTPTLDATLEDSAWLTSECGDKNGLDVLSLVSNPAVRQETITTALGETREVTATLNFAFERFVIGTPGGKAIAEHPAFRPDAVLVARKEGK